MASTDVPVFNLGPDAALAEYSIETATMTVAGKVITAVDLLNDPNALIKFHDSLGKEDQKIFQKGMVGMTAALADGCNVLETSGTNHLERSRILLDLAKVENKVHAAEHVMLKHCHKAHGTAFAVSNAILKKEAAHHLVTREQMEQMTVAAAEKVEAAKKKAEATAKQLEVTVTKAEETEKKLQSTITFLRRRVNQYFNL